MKSRRFVVTRPEEVSASFSAVGNWTPSTVSSPCVHFYFSSYLCSFWSNVSRNNYSRIKNEWSQLSSLPFCVFVFWICRYCGLNWWERSFCSVNVDCTVIGCRIMKTSVFRLVPCKSSSYVCRLAQILFAFISIKH